MGRFERNFQNLIKTGPILVESLGLLWGNKKCVWGGVERERRAEKERSHCICSQAGPNRTQRGGLESGLDVVLWGGAR